MPPSRHSSSSHHSSSSSHHSSHSSHSSRSSYSSSSSRSYGSSSYRSSSSSYGSYRSAPVKRVPRPARARTNQPLNYIGKTATHDYRCKAHDYTYYGENWTDSSTGKNYLKGYYDEKGNRYDQLIIDRVDGSFESLFECMYCGTQTKQVWKEGAIPQCQNCGANLLESMGASVIHDRVDTSTVPDYQRPYSGSYRSSPYDTESFLGGCLKKIVIAIVAIAALFGIALLDDSSGNSNNITYNNGSDYQTIVNTNIELFGDSIYVDSIDRTLDWNDEYQSYYDPVSDCYLWYDTDDEPAVWQYWYENISSDYGDYGWMEYELDEDQWYIEADEGNWIKLPSKYDTSELWHITGDLAGTSYSKDYNLEYFGKSIKVDDDTASYFWSDEYVAYYIKSEDCYVRVNFDVKDPTPQYWYEEVSSTFCDEDGYGGWMEYDYTQDAWYVLDMYGDWNNLGDEYNNLWHIDSKITGFTGTEVELTEAKKVVHTGVTSDSSHNTEDMLVTYPNNMDYSSNYFIVSYYFQTTNEDFIIFDNGKMFTPVDKFVVSEDSFNDVITTEVNAHKPLVEQFFFQMHEEQPVTSIDELKAHNFSMGERMDVTDWFGSEISLLEEDGETSHDYKITKVELSLQDYSYEGDKRDYYDKFGIQYIVDDQYVFIQGIQFNFFFE